jgi:alkylhydroperoxidase/carboxymuconolactone decarboxylase family protein YurZ
MRNIQENHLTNREKNLIAMSAAMGAGCRKCADKLYGVAKSLTIPEKEMLMAFQWGLDAKAEAIGTMRAKVSELLGDGKGIEVKTTDASSKKLAALARIASFVAANSAPDVASEIQKAKGDDITPDQIQTCISLARMVRKNAGLFSDQEISDKVGSFGSTGEEMCCPLALKTILCPTCILSHISCTWKRRQNQNRGT